MKFISLLNVIALCFAITACGKKSPGSSKKYTKITKEQLRDVLENQYITCDSVDGSDCPAGVTRLLTLNLKQAEKSSVCSGFMVGKNTLVTNHHCVEDMTDCRNTYLIIYNGGDYIQSRCKKIISTKQDYPDASDPRRAVDYTVMEIEGTYEGKTFKMASTKATTGQAVSAWVVDHIGLDSEYDANLYEARITQFACKVAAPTGHASLILNNCPVVHGNSGSPAVNSAGDIVGVIWGASAKYDTSMDLETRRAKDDVAAVTEYQHFSPFITKL